MEKLIGRIVENVIIQGDDEIWMYFKDGSYAKWYHYQDCCESVVIDDVNGDWKDLYGHPLLVAEERIGNNTQSGHDQSETWTFYTFRSIGGSVDVKWHGSSNGYYSESVDFEFVDVVKT
jgi:hypothetical protein